MSEHKPVYWDPKRKQFYWIECGLRQGTTTSRRSIISRRYTMPQEKRREESEMTQLQIVKQAIRQVLDLPANHVLTDADRQGVTWLDLGGTQITNAGLKHLAALTALEWLAVTDTQITDAGVKHLAALTALELLGLAGTKVTDAGVKHLAGLTALKLLYLTDTQITDAGVEHLAGLTALKLLDLTDTQITDAGAKQLRAALPGCTIAWP